MDAGGFEIDLIHPWHKNFYWFANATYTQTNVENSLDPRQNNSDVPFVPKWMANVGFTTLLPYDFTVSPYLFNCRYEMPWQFRDVGFQALGSLELRF